MFMTRAGTVALSPIDADAADGWVDHRGPLVADLHREWSHTALTRVAEEVALQHQLLALGFLWSVRRQTADAGAGARHLPQTTQRDRRNRRRTCPQRTRVGLGRNGSGKGDRTASVFRASPVRV